MSNKLSSYSFRSLLALFDEQIYSSFSIQKKSYCITSYISWDSIYKYFPNQSAFFSILALYHQTVVREVTKSGFKMRPLVISCDENNTGIEIKHNTDALSIYLYHADKSTIENTYIANVFLNALSKFNMKSDVLYEIISKGKTYKTSPEELKAMLGINYTNAMLKSRILIPIEKVISKLYMEGSLPFYIKINIGRAVIGRGSKINTVAFDIINEIDVLRLARLRSEYMKFIMQQLKKLYPFDYPFIEEKIIKREDKTIHEIYTMLSRIEEDPDFHKIATPTLVKFKLRQDFNISID